MRGSFVRKRKNRTRTVRILENMKRPTVIVAPFTEEQVRLEFLKNDYFSSQTCICQTSEEQRCNSSSILLLNTELFDNGSEHFY